ncbi:MAG: signal peptidase I [bacterium]|nr:signal peptidase I [bacterium]
MAVKNVEVYSERSRVPADGSMTKLYLRFAGEAPPVVTLRLTRGSFDAEGRVKHQQFNVENNEVHLQFFAPRRPGPAFLIGPGIKHRLDFIATSLQQSLIHEWVPTLAIAIALALLIRTNAIASFFIPSGSMENTLRRGDLLIADKLSYKLLHNDPQRGDVMIFRYPDNPKLDYIKRVIGLPGDIIEVHDGKVFVNGGQLKETYIKEEPFSTYGPVQVPQEKYFVMGDNRNHSSDSRVWGYVPRKNFEGRALFVFWPPTRAKVIRNGLQGEVIPGPEAVSDKAGGGLQ